MIEPGVKEACCTALESPELRRIADALRGSGIEAWSELGKVTHLPQSSDRLKELAQAKELNPVDFARWLLLNAALAALSRIPSWRVTDAVRRLWADEVFYFARPSGDLSDFALDHVRFQEMARTVTLRRYPAGQFHWEVTGFPRSWVLKTRPLRWPALLSTIGLKLGGFGPLVDTHLNARRKNRPLVTESESIRSYYRMAQSLELQPEIRGMLTASWFYCAETAAVTPHLAWMRQFFIDRGAFIESLGPAPADAGFLIGSELRRKLYQEGKYRPTTTYVLWPRAAMLDWSRSVTVDRV